MLKSLSIRKMLLSLCYVLFFTGCSAPTNAANDIQALYKSVNQGVVELHVQVLATPKLGQVAYKEEMAESLGSGALITKEGRILTAAHVVDRATDIEVIFADGTKTTGHVVWVDSLIDIAMIQAGEVPSSAKVLKMAEPSNYGVGEQVVVIGAPYGVSHSLSVGYLSGIRDDEEIPGLGLTPRLVQTDAAINQGNSGGPMFNLEGEVLGIVSHILSQSGGNNGLGFAISVDTIKEVMSTEPVNFFGFIPFPLDEETSAAINNPYGYGLLIQQVIPGTLADKLGFRGGKFSVMVGNIPFLLGGDVIVAIGGHPLKDFERIVEMRQRLSEAEKGTEIVFKFLRSGEVKEVTWIKE